MNILYLDWSCFGQVDVDLLFQKRGYQVYKFFHEDYLERKSQAFMEAAELAFDENEFDFCFSFNYYPLMAEVCYQHKLKYIAFLYDNPQVKLYSYTAKYSTSYIFCFDSSMVDTFSKLGYTNFYYMPLPVNGTIIDYLLTKPYDKLRASAEVSFVGSMYDEFYRFYDVFEKTSLYTQGYLEGLISAQLKVDGYNFIEQCLSEDIIKDLQRVVGYKPEFDGTEGLSYVFSDYYISRKVTAIERRQILEMVSEQYPVKLFTFDEKTTVGKCKNMGLADYYEDMPYIFHDSKINLNITLRSIKNGISLRCMDILGNKGFLLTNYQSDFLKHFVPGEDFVYYEDRKDLMNKIEYYLCYEEERKAIAESGHDKILRYHNYEVIFDEILNIVLG